MDTVTLSTKYQILIPPTMRDSLNLKPGQRFSVFNINGHIHLVPLRPIKELRGRLKGIASSALREKSDRTL